MSYFWKRWWLVIACLTCCITVWACRPNPDPEIVIGVIVPLTGDVSLTSGRPTLEGIELAVQMINEEGGFEIKEQRYPVELIVADDQDDPSLAAAAAHQLINQDKVVALVGMPLSRNAIPVAQVAEAAGIPMISSKSTNPQTTAGKEYVFRVTFTDAFQAEVIATLVRDKLQVQRAAVLYDVASDYNKYLAESFQTAFENRGGDVVAFETYVTDNPQFEQSLEAIKLAQPEVLFLPNYPAEVLNQAQMARDLGLDIPLIGADSWTGFGDFSDPALEGALYTADWSDDIDTPQTTAFLAAYRQQYNHVPTSAAALGYDAIQLLFTAIQTQDSFEPQMIQTGLTQIRDYPGVTGSISYGQGGDPSKDAAILQVQKGKSVFFESVRPKE
ncbi:MAG: ABC transporter substrate-binding protein [Spirulina sp. SIO3F2]|nr:ABC transporter substrate-binding protein [Spirulina sp. SIO3F2]